MKIIGRVKEQYNEDGSIEDVQYLGGSIVMLTKAEVTVLDALQDVIEGGTRGFSFRYTSFPGDLDETEMSATFGAIRTFVETKLYVNELRDMVNRFDNMLMEAKE